jgi:protocatechuate 3,4-dioxygenase beta subunit
LALIGLFRSRASLKAEILTLCHQLNVLRRKSPQRLSLGNHKSAWRPAHIHFSMFGHSFLSRVVTQMYFPNDPLFEFDPIFNSVPDEKARMRMVSSFDLDSTQPDWALAYRFNIVLRGRNATPLETHR